MSTEIKPGQVWAWRARQGDPFTINSLNGDMAEYHYGRRVTHSTYSAPVSLIQRTADLVTDATPASLDPSKVKAGDTVTVRIDTDTDVPSYTTVGTAYQVGSVMRVGQIDLDGPGVVLIDHQPAPEPEPKWTPGTTGTAHIVSGDATTKDGRVFRRMRGMVVHRPAPIDDDMFVTVEGELWGLEGEYCKNFVPDDPRPLPTWAEIHNAIAANLPADIDSLRKMTNDIEALLGGESR